MDRRRYRQGYLRCFAALALLAQLLVAATHVHSNGPHGPRTSLSAPHDTGWKPAGPVHQGDEFCPLCWAQTAAGSLVPPPVVELRIPANDAAALPAPAFHPLAGRDAPNAFRPRAPPASNCA